jgi:hypothetical protein
VVNYHTAIAVKSGSDDSSSTNGNSASNSNDGRSGKSDAADKKTGSSDTGNNGKPDKKSDQSSTISSPFSPSLDNSNPSTPATTTTLTNIDKKDNNNNAINKDTTTDPSSSGIDTCPDVSKPAIDGKCKATQQQEQEQQQPHPDDDCLFNPSLSKCKSVNEQCPKGFFLNDDDNCVPDKNCPSGFEHHAQDETGTCYPIKVKIDCKKNPNDPSCNATTPPSSGPDNSCLFHPEQDKCKPDQYGNCPSGFFLNDDEHCVPNKPCPPGFKHHFEDETGTCYPINKPSSSSSCPQNHHMNNGVCNKDVVVHVTTVDTITKNLVSNNVFAAPSQGKQPSFLVLLDTAQLCNLAGDTQCAAQQSHFKTVNLITKFDSTTKNWNINGQVENVAAGSKTQKNIGVGAYFYDSKGNNVGGSYHGAVTPTTLKSLQSGTINFKASILDMKSTPSFIRLEYQSTGS